MRTKIFGIVGVLLLASAALFAQKASPREEDAGQAGATFGDGAGERATQEMSARASAAIPLRRTTQGLRILPFIDQQGQPVAIERPLLAFLILPFVDSRGNLIPAMKNGPAILPFVDQSGEPIPIGKVRLIEPIFQ